MSFHDLTAFNVARANRLAWAAELAYEQPETIERTVNGEWEYPRFRFVDVDGTQAFVASGQRATVVSFRGTEVGEIADWATDLDFALVDGPLGGKVHAGFYDALSHVWRILDECVTEFGTPTRPLWVTGHSLGAALATLAVARWREAGRPVSGLYTFGQPRTGDRTFARNFDFEFRPYAFRFVNNNDLVTRIPPRASGYRHVGTFRYFTAPGDLRSGISWWDRFLDGWQGRAEDILDWCGVGLGDHSMRHYRTLLHKAAGYDGCEPCETTRHLRVHRPPEEEEAPRLIRPRRRAA